MGRSRGRQYSPRPPRRLLSWLWRSGFVALASFILPCTTQTISVTTILPGALDGTSTSRACDAFFGVKLDGDDPLEWRFDPTQNFLAVSQLVDAPSSNMTQLLKEFYDVYFPWHPLPAGGMLPVCDKLSALDDAAASRCLSMTWEYLYRPEQGNATTAVSRLKLTSGGFDYYHVGVNISYLESRTATLQWYLSPSERCNAVADWSHTVPLTTSDMYELTLANLEPLQDYSVTIRLPGLRFDAVGHVQLQTTEGVFAVSHPTTALGVVAFDTALVYRYYIHQPWPGPILGFHATSICAYGTSLTWDLAVDDATNVELIQITPETLPLWVLRFRGLAPATVHTISVSIRNSLGLGGNTSFTGRTRDSLPKAPVGIVLSCDPMSRVEAYSCRVSWQLPERPGGIVLGYQVGRDIDIAAGKLGLVVSTIDNPNVTFWEGRVDLDDQRGFRVRGLSSFGPTSWSDGVYLRDVVPAKTTLGQNGDNDQVDMAIVLGVLLPILFILFLAVLLLRQHHMRQLHDQSQRLPTPPKDAWDVSPDCYSVHKHIGAGSFGVVALAYATGVPGMEVDEPILVAVKTCSVDASRENKEAFLAEAAIMKLLGSHDHVISLLAVSLQQEPFFILIEYAQHGDLRNHLVLSKQLDTPLDLPQRMLLAWHIAAGMNYLTSRQIVHRDLAARNCLLAKDMVVKIGDFGLSRKLSTGSTVFCQKGFEIMPVRWMAPECLTSGYFSQASDVWSFGVTLYEILSDGALPYKGMNNEDVYQAVLRGYRLPTPNEVYPPDIIKMMYNCWEHLRPTFAELEQWCGAFHDQACNSTRKVLAAQASEHQPNFRIFSAACMDSEGVMGGLLGTDTDTKDTENAHDCGKDAIFQPVAPLDRYFRFRPSTLVKDQDSAISRTDVHDRVDCVTRIQSQV